MYHLVDILQWEKFHELLDLIQIFEEIFHGSFNNTARVNSAEVAGSTMETWSCT